MPIDREKALLVMTLVARRSSAWAHDIVSGSPISDGTVSDDAVSRYAKDIMEALTVLTERKEA